MKDIIIKLIAASLLTACAFSLVSCTAKKPIAPENTEAPAEESIVFFGDSITYLGDWESWFSGHKVTNLGVSGDRIADLIDRVDQVTAAKPTKLFVMVGVNDILTGYDPADIIAEHEKLLKELQDKLPGCEIYVESVLPADRAYPNSDRILAYDSELSALAEKLGLEYIDLFPLYRDRSGFLMSQYTGDGLHLLRDAYEQWVEQIRPLIDNK